MPATMKASLSTKTQPPVVSETWQYMTIGGGGFVKWNNDCKFTSPTVVGVKLSDSKEKCAETCWNSTTCRHFEFSRKTQYGKYFFGFINFPLRSLIIGLLLTKIRKLVIYSIEIQIKPI